MTAPRVPLFQRKGAVPPGPSKPALTIAIHGQDKPEGSAGGPDEESMSPGEPATCPACGCVFDPATGEIQEQAHPEADATGMSAPAGGPAEQPPEGA